MSKIEKSSWLLASVWFIQSSEDIWNAGFVINYGIIDSTLHIWSFTVAVAADSSSPTFTSAPRVEIITKSLDLFGLDFEWIKRRDKDSENIRSIKDMTSLSYLNEPEIIECMRQRFLSKQIYTNTGSILMAVNPFESLPLYGEDKLNEYSGASDVTELRSLGPHVYQISDFAYRKMFVDRFDADKRENQSILVNGESGAGKTESTKRVLHYLAKVSNKVTRSVAEGSIDDDFEHAIKAANPITESFGNAKTSRNNNSSRFGKFIELLYAAEGYIEGATIRTYLLETVRVVSQMQGERNYHVFYEVFSGLSKDQKEAWGIIDLTHFYYTNQSGELNRHDGESDAENFKNLKDALVMIDIVDKDQDDVFRLVVTILHIGNLSFEDSGIAGEDAAVFAPTCRANVDAILSFLEVSEEVLLAACAKRSLTVRGEVMQKSLNKDAAVAGRDAFAKSLYNSLFNFMIKRINDSLMRSEASESASFIGVLDIFGFEHFQKNSFEQVKKPKHSFLYSKRTVFLRLFLLMRCDVNLRF